MIQIMLVKMNLVSVVLMLVVLVDQAYLNNEDVQQYEVYLNVNE
ncbi:unnamed protein product [Trichobilharzia regenti]|nr:unnamed protein product [Trichobilharzia regenti]